MKRFLLLLCGLGIMLAAALPVAVAQGEPISANEFWQRIADTASLLDAAPPDAADRVDSLWSGVEAVRVGDDLLPVDVHWITDAARSPDSETQAALRRYLQALTALKPGGAASSSPASLDSLRDILTDPRFHYDEEPQPESSPAPSVTPPSSGTLDWLMVVIVALVAIPIVLYVIRALRVQVRTLPSSGEEEEPKTSADARALAATFENERDYRAAIRYLFLALLLLLDERGLIQYDRTLTNREHLRQVSGNTRLAELLRPVVATFDDVWYGFIPIDETGYRRFEQQVDQLKALVP